MLLQNVDNEIHQCNLCGDMIEKFPNSKTVSIGKRNDIVILGEAPANNGWRKSGIAWYDINHKLLPSGVVLQKLLDEINLKIEDTYFLEAIKCYPKDRKYLKICSKNCQKFLFKQLEIIKPKMILSLGDAATKSILDIKYKNFSDIVGKIFIKDGYKIIPIYHPSPISPNSYKGNINIFKNILKEVTMNTNNIEINTQSSIKLILNKILYFDPYKIEKEIHNADIIFITHDHYDHLDIESINKIKNNNTIIVAPKSIEKKIKDLQFNKYIYLNPNEETNIEDINIKTIPSYNIEKPYHPKSNNWLGYIISNNDITYYIAGDTDKTNEAEQVKCDIALIPIGGKFTMNVKEATELIKTIKPKIVIPTHYGSIIGTQKDGKILKENLNDKTIEVIEKL